MFSKSSVRSNVRLYWGVYLVLTAALAGGLYARLAGFGKRPLGEDEYFFAESVDHILKHGLPRFDDGGYYVQGLLPQYVTAVSFKLFGDTNTALRLPALVFGLLAPVLAYRYVRLYLPVPLALLLSTALLASSWGIEFSRFGRMYTELQCATLAFLYRFDCSIIGTDWKKRYRAHGWAVIAVLCHFQGAILAPLLFLPLLNIDDRERFPDRESIIQYSLLAAMVVALIGGFAAFDFRRWGAMNPFPPGYTPPNVSFLRTPQFAFWNPTGHLLVTLAIIISLLILTLAFGLVLSRKGFITVPQVGLLLLVVAGLLHQGTIAILVVLALVLRYGFRDTISELYRQRFLVGIAVGLFLIWVGVAAMVGDNWIRVSGAGSWIGAARRTFLSWPDWFDFVQPWRYEFPIVGTLTLLSIVVLLFFRGPSTWVGIFCGPAGILMYSLLTFGVLRYFFETTRYFFLFFPVALAAVAAASNQLFGLWRGVVVFAVAFAISGDFSPRHIVAAGEPAVAFRTGPFSGNYVHWYPREDYESVGEYLQKVAADKPETLFVVHYAVPLARQFQPLRYSTYLPRASYGFYQCSREAGTRDVWTNRLLLSTPEELREASRSDQEIWIVRRVSAESQLQPEIVWGDRLERVDREFVSRDGRLEVLRVSLKTPRQ